MRKLGLIGVWTLLLGGWLMGYESAANAEEPVRPNIVLIMADDLGYGDLSSYGARTQSTPVLDKMAREGIRFTRFQVAQAVCTASRAALLTGCYPNRIGLSGALNHTSRKGLAPTETTLAELCQSRGYATAIFGKWHLGHEPELLPTRQGFDTWAGIPYSNDNGPLHPTVKGIPPLPWYENEVIAEHDPDQSQFTKRLTDHAVAFIRSNRERPFFLYIPHIMPHVPIAASLDFRGRSKGGLYGDTVEELDASIGRILAALQEAGVERRTLVLFTSDNGPFLSYGTHAGKAGRLREGKLTVFEGGVCVPFIVRWPGVVPAGRVEKRFLTSLDLLPSLAGLVGATLPKTKIDGLDLGPLLLGKAGSKGRETFFYYSGDELQAVRIGPWKLHLRHDYLSVAGTSGTDGKPANYANMKPNVIEESGVRGIASRHGYEVRVLEESLYNLESDPGEMRNLARRYPKRVKQLLEVVEEARRDLGDALTQRRGENLRKAGGG